MYEYLYTHRQWHKQQCLPISELKEEEDSDLVSALALGTPKHQREQGRVQTDVPCDNSNRLERSITSQYRAQLSRLEPGSSGRGEQWTRVTLLVQPLQCDQAAGRAHQAAHLARHPQRLPSQQQPIRSES